MNIKRREWEKKTMKNGTEITSFHLKKQHSLSNSTPVLILRPVLGCFLDFESIVCDWSAPSFDMTIRFICLVTQTWNCWQCSGENKNRKYSLVLVCGWSDSYQDKCLQRNSSHHSAPYSLQAVQEMKNKYMKFALHKGYKDSIFH